MKPNYHANTKAAKAPVILSTKNDWQLWYRTIMLFAMSAGIWNEINPDITPKPAIPTKPEEPTEAEADHWNSGRLEFHLSEIARWEMDRDARKKVLDLIIDSVKTKVPKIYKSGSNDVEETIRARDEYNAVCRTVVSQDNISSWITNFECAAAQLKQLRGDRWDEWQACEDFLHGIRTISPFFYGRHLYMTLEKPDEADLSQLVSLYRLKLNYQAIEEHRRPALSTVRGQTVLKAEMDQKPGIQHSQPGLSLSHKGKKKRNIVCFCGGNHWFKDCFHLNPNAIGRPQDFHPNPEYIAKAKEEIAQRTKKAPSLKRVLYGEINNSQSIPTIAITMRTNHGHHDHRNDFIVSTGAMVNVCNNRDWFDTFIECDEEIGVGSKLDRVRGVGTVTVRPSIGTGTAPILTVSNVRYVPGFHTNIISGGLMADVGLDLIATKEVILYRGRFWCKVRREENLFVLEKDRPMELLPASTMGPLL
ncbi:hypothetical protein BJY04DRAFT_221569 [Aspergillus karnatakaensis]|uniref:uncharacterized protein n=1 Tax=Aspergillus karnatakaensis TaxID=1810916 RepID=UPI003CCCEB05